MAVIDIIVLVVVIGGALYGFTKGLIQQMGAAIALVAAILGCRLMGDAGASMLEGLFTGGPDSSATVALASRALANVIIFVMVYIVVRVLVKGLKVLSRLMLMGPVDKILGALFSVVEWTMALSIVLNLWIGLKPDSRLMDGASDESSMIISTAYSFAPAILGGPDATDNADNKAVNNAGAESVE